VYQDLRSELVRVKKRGHVDCGCLEERDISHLRFLLMESKQRTIVSVLSRLPNCDKNVRVTCD